MLLFSKVFFNNLLKNLFFQFFLDVIAGNFKIYFFYFTLTENIKPIGKIDRIRVPMQHYQIIRVILACPRYIGYGCVVGTLFLRGQICIAPGTVRPVVFIRVAGENNVLNINWSSLRH